MRDHRTILPFVGFPGKSRESRHRRMLHFFFHRCLLHLALGKHISALAVKTDEPRSDMTVMTSEQWEVLHRSIDFNGSLSWKTFGTCFSPLLLEKHTILLQIFPSNIPEKYSMPPDPRCASCDCDLRLRWPHWPKASTSCEHPTSHEWLVILFHHVSSIDTSYMQCCKPKKTCSISQSISARIGKNWVNH